MTNGTAEELTDGWTLAATAPASAPAPSDLASDLEWRDATVPGTVASAIGPEGPDGHENYDARDWWYRRTIEGSVTPGETVRLRFDGLATLASVWWNGTCVAESTNMFSPFTVDVTDLVTGNDELVVCFHSLDHELARKRPRPRWKTRLIAHQQLRWHRTTLLGRIPGWMPDIRPVGPWRSVWLERTSGLDLERWSLTTAFDDGAGRLTLVGDLSTGSESGEVRSARVHVGEEAREVSVREVEDGWRIEADVRLESVQPWWPATHGEPALYDCRVELETEAGPVSVECGRVGFRSVSLNTEDGRIAFVVNGVEIFARGACWTSSDLRSPGTGSEATRRTLELLAAANGNMVRVGGTMVYESDAFYRACDELGVMVWQDFMFANMDYPVADDAFAASTALEADQQLRRLAGHPSVVAFCGGSEVEQQAAMFGAPSEIWSNDLFSDTLPRLVQELGGTIPYWTSTPTGGAMPFHVGEGLTHYWGVGAYRRTLDDARTSRVRFSPECLGFSNVPEPANLAGLVNDGAAFSHHPAWKAGVPRDSGAPWDFEDVRDYWLEELYGVDARELRATDIERYWLLSRATPGRAMGTVFDEWRSSEHGCGGGLVWFLQDLRPGAGWGIVDSDRNPKSAYHYLKRAWEPVRLALLNRGLDGVVVELHNEAPQPLAVEVRVSLYDDMGVRKGDGTAALQAPAHGTGRASVEGILGHFADPAYAYRFGPRGHAVVTATADIPGLGDRYATLWPVLAAPLPCGTPELELTGEGPHRRLTLTASQPLRDVRIRCAGWDCSDNYFDLVPDLPVTVELEARVPDAPLRGVVTAENVRNAIRLSG